MLTWDGYFWDGWATWDALLVRLSHANVVWATYGMGYLWDGLLLGCPAGEY